MTISAVKIFPNAAVPGLWQYRIEGDTIAGGEIRGMYKGSKADTERLIKKFIARHQEPDTRDWKIVPIPISAKRRRPRKDANLTSS